MRNQFTDNTEQVEIRIQVFSSEEREDPDALVSVEVVPFSANHLDNIRSQAIVEEENQNATFLSEAFPILAAENVSNNQKLLVLLEIGVTFGVVFFQFIILCIFAFQEKEPSDERNKEMLRRLSEFFLVGLLALFVTNQNMERWNSTLCPSDPASASPSWLSSPERRPPSPEQRPPSPERRPLSPERRPLSSAESEFVNTGLLDDALSNFKRDADQDARFTSIKQAVQRMHAPKEEAKAAFENNINTLFHSPEYKYPITQTTSFSDDLSKESEIYRM